MKIKEIDFDYWDALCLGFFGLVFAFGTFCFGQSWRSDRAYCEAACYPVDVSACEHDFAVCWNDDRIRKIRRRK